VLDGNVSTLWHTQYGGTVAPLPHTLTIDMKATATVGALKYLPRPGGGNGTIGQYRVEVSLNGTTWGTPVATGTWVDDATEKTATFASVSARFVRLTALTEAGNRGPWTSAAEINLIGSTATTTTPPPTTTTAPPPTTTVPPTTVPPTTAPPTTAPPTTAPPTTTPPVTGVLPRTGWTVAADSQETVGQDGAAINVLDGNPATMWHTKWQGTADPLPHTLTVDMKTAVTVFGFKYLPRDFGTNGNIGQYRIEVSLDGTAWGTPVATGTFADDQTEKTVTFASVSARFVRLTALTEAGNRGPWSSAAEINVLGSTGPPPTPSQGNWTAPIGFPVIPVAAALLPTNKMLVWSAYSPTVFGGSTGVTQTALYDLATGTVSQETVSNTGHDMFCPGTAILPDGRVLVNGGSNSDKTSIYDPFAAAWSASSPLVTPRGYQAAVTLSDGQVFTLGGSWSGAVGDKNGEIWSPTTGSRALPGALIAPALTNDPQGAYRADNHAWLFAWTNNRVFQAGPSKAMNWYGTTGTGSTTAAGTRADDTDAMNGNAVMYEPGHILTVGGATAYQNANATANAYLVDITGPAVSVTKLPSMANTRSFANSVVLPDGKVLVIGGQNVPVPFSDDTSVLTPELWDPATKAFTTMAPMAVPRVYHSVALLLPDGRVFSGGGGLCGTTCSTNHSDGQIFTPPYLLNADGSAKPRPTITAAPGTATAGATISVTTDRAVAAFSLVRMGSTTHSVDTDQRRIPLTISAVNGSTASLILPPDRGVIVPGYYMLFALDAAGVPSVSKVVKVS
jgi:galactose oxidase